MIHKLYPYRKRKTFNVTYNDGVVQDIRFVKLFSKDFILCVIYN